MYLQLVKAEDDQAVEEGASCVCAYMYMCICVHRCMCMNSVCVQLEKAEDKQAMEGGQAGNGGRTPLRVQVSVYMFELVFLFQVYPHMHTMYYFK